MLYAIGRLRLLPRPLSPWAATLLLFLAYILPAAGTLLYAEHVVSARVAEILFPLPWLADGVAVSLTLLWGPRSWPGIFLGSIFIWGVLRGDPAVTVGVDAIGETLSVVITVSILRAWHFRRQLDRLVDPLILLVAALTGRLVAAIADVGGVLVAVWLTPHSLPPEFLRAATRPGTLTPAVTAELVWALTRWQVTALAGIALAVPALLSSPRKLRHALRARRLSVAGLGTLSALWVFGVRALSATWTCWPLLLAAVLLVAWAAMEFGALTAALCTLLFACTAGVAFCQGVGPLAAADAVGGLAATWGFIGLLCCVSPVLTVILTVRNHRDQRLTILADRYRSLFNSTPTPAWVADAESGAILMANAEAIRRYGYTESEFLLMRMSELSGDSGGPDEPPPPEGELIAAPLIRHLTSDGRVMNVELISTALELDGRPVALTYAVDLTDHQDLRRRLLATVDRESFRVAQELHDGLGQVLAGLAIDSEALLQRTEHTPGLDPSGTTQLCDLTSHAQQAESQLFRLTSGVPPLDDPEGDPLEPLRRLPATLPAPERARLDEGAEGRAPGNVRQFSLSAYLAVSAFIVVTCWIGGAISHWLASASRSHFTYADVWLAVPSPLAGIAAAALLQGGQRYWPSVFIGVLLARLGLMGEPIGTALLQSAVGTVGCCALVAWMRRWRFTASLDRWQDPLVLCLLAGAVWALITVSRVTVYALLVAHDRQAVAPGIAALFGSSAAKSVSLTPALAAAMARWWFDALAGTVLVVPTLTLASTLRRVLKESLTELCAWCACLALWTLLLLAVPAHEVLLPLLTLSILLVVWAAARLGVALASLATLMFAMLAAASFSTHTGALATQDAVTGVITVWGFIGVLTLISLFLAALLAEHNRRHGEIAAVNKRYRSLFHGDPRPLWLHDARTGQIVEANEPAARTYGYSMAEFTTLKVAQLLAPGASHDALATAGDAASGPLTMKHLKKSGDSMEVEVWSYGTFLDGRRVSICFAHDVTERNTLRRLLFDRAELERRELAVELRRTLSGPLAELRIVAHKLMLELGRRAAPERMRELLESLARQSKRAAECCREVAHRLSPLQANCGNLVAALQTLRRRIPAGVPLEISVVGESPLQLDQQQSEHLYSLLSEILTRCQADRQGVVHVALSSFGHTVRVAVDADLQASSAAAVPSLARHPSVLLRVRAMGARLWERSMGGAHTRLVCDYPL